MDLELDRNAILKQDGERIVAREGFSKKYITLHSIYGSNASRYYETFKEAFYDVRNAKQLLVIKGLAEDDDVPVRDTGIYLDRVSTKELKALTKGVEIILDVMRKVEDERFIYDNITEAGRIYRYQFINENDGELPEELPLEETSIKQVKKCLTQTKVKFRPKTKQTTLTDNFNANNTQTGNQPSIPTTDAKTIGANEKPKKREWVRTDVKHECHHCGRCHRNVHFDDEREM